MLNWEGYGHEFIEVLIGSTEETDQYVLQFAVLVSSLITGCENNFRTGRCDINYK
jgi:hypothetical protein